jgi:hypothetical protein
MKALIFENKVVDVQATEFEVAPTMSWVDCDNQAKEQAKADLKASAKAKLIAGEKLTEEEANILVGV